MPVMDLWRWINVPTARGGSSDHVWDNATIDYGPFRFTKEIRYLIRFEV
jgi:hypothetical protein